MNLTAQMKPTFWARFNLGNMIRRTARENIYRKYTHHYFSNVFTI